MFEAINRIIQETEEHSIKFLSSFAYLQFLDDHPVLFKCHKPLFLIQGPIQIYEDDLFYGQLFTQLQKYLDTIFYHRNHLILLNIKRAIPILIWDSSFS